MKKQACTLLPFQNITSDKSKAIPLELNDYFTLVDWSGRAILEKKRGSIPAGTLPILTRLGIDVIELWVSYVS